MFDIADKNLVSNNWGHLNVRSKFSCFAIVIFSKIGRQPKQSSWEVSRGNRISLLMYKLRCPPIYRHMSAFSVCMHVPMLAIWSAHFCDANVMGLRFTLVHVFLAITYKKLKTDSI